MATVDCGFEGRPEELVQSGPTIVVQIGFDPKYLTFSQYRPNLPRTQFHALVDTGATESCIDSAVAMDLDLPIVDQQNLAGAHGVHPANVYLAQIYIPELEVTIGGRFSGVHLTAGGQAHSALIGKSFLLHFTMIYEGQTGAVRISRSSAEQ